MPCRHFKIHLLAVLGPDTVRQIQAMDGFSFGFGPQDAKVDELDTPIWCEQDIVRLDIPMSDPPRFIVEIS